MSVIASGCDKMWRYLAMISNLWLATTWPMSPYMQGQDQGNLVPYIELHVATAELGGVIRAQGLGFS